MNEDVKTFGATLMYGDAGGTASTPLAGIRQFDSLPNRVYDEYEVTEVDQDDPTKLFRVTVADNGTLGVTLSMTEDRLDDLDDLDDQDDHAWLVNFSNGSKLAFEGPIKRIGLTAGNANTGVLVPLEVRINGPWVYTAPPGD